MRRNRHSAGAVEGRGEGDYLRARSHRQLPLLGYHKEVNAADYYPRIECPTLILRATEGTLSPDDRVLPENAVERMLKEIPDAHCVPVNGANHYSILFQPNPARDDAVDNFLSRLNP